MQPLQASHAAGAAVCHATAASTLQEPGSNSLTADNLEKFGKLNHSPGVPEDGALLSEAKLQSIISFLDEMEKSEQERPRSATSATQREVSTGLCWGGGPHRGRPLPLPRFHVVSTFPYSFFSLSQGLLSEEELAHLEQASAVATEVTSSIMRLKLEVEEKKRAISLLQTALVCEPDALACWEGGQRALSRRSFGAVSLKHKITVFLPVPSSA